MDTGGESIIVVVGHLYCREAVDGTETLITDGPQPIRHVGTETDEWISHTGNVVDNGHARMGVLLDEELDQEAVLRKSSVATISDCGLSPPPVHLYPYYT
jgi:hypothetical protein